MAKGFRLRLWRAFPAAFRSCRDDDPVVAAVASSACCLPPDISDCFSVVELLQPSPLRPPLQPSPLRPPLKPPSILSRSSPRRYLRSASASGPSRKTNYDDGNATWGKGDGSRLRRRRRRRRETMRRWGSSSSADEDSGWFSGGELDVEFDHYYGEGGGAVEEEEKTEALISSADVDSSVSSFCQGRTKTINGRCGCGRRSWAAEDAAVAVAKLSEDPREDFRRSMAEMVVDKKIFDAAGLEQLLLCFLSLNPRDHHAAIIAAFGDVWAAVSPASGGGRRRAMASLRP